MQVPSPHSHLRAKDLSSAGRPTVSPERSPSPTWRLAPSRTVDGVGGEGGQTGLAEAAMLTPQYPRAVGGRGGLQGGAGGKQEKNSMAFPNKDRPLCSLGPPALGGCVPVGRDSPATRAVLLGH